MHYDAVHNWLGWPNRDQAFEPSGAGAQVYADFAKKKLVSALNQAHPGVEISVGVIVADPHSDSSEAPLALVCEFPRAASNEVLNLTHRLAWNFSRTALLITLEPHQLIAWSCYQDPTQGESRVLCKLRAAEGLTSAGTPQQHEVRDLLHWVNLITHRAQRMRPEQFRTDGRADVLLLKNLRYVRGELLRRGLAQDHCHDLLARIIFTQFLFHRKDSDGNAFFSSAKMRRLHEDGTLSKIHEDLASLLSHKGDTYALFRWMDERFNGDLFPGKDGESEEARNATWKAEKDAVSAEDHLKLLAGLVRGDLDVAHEQHLLWPQYSFDTIPLEFISSVYEEFLTAEERGNDKAYYTPSHLVDYVLDAVLPWNSDDWNVRILDPCCGSGVFLVKAFQRLIYRWRRAHPEQSPLVRDLRPILENNLVGVDKNPEAVRVACFSLYLAMADAIEPKHYVTHENYKVFPRLRATRLIHRDFFDEEAEEIRTVEDKQSFNYVLGNAPWGDGSIFPDRLRSESKSEYRKRIANLPPTPGRKWAQVNNWPVANNDIGPLFLAKAAMLTKPEGVIGMVNTASLLYWRDGQAVALRKKLFTSFTFEEVTNLSALRRELFTEAIGPACILMFRTKKPDGQKTLHYYTPKPVRPMKLKRGKSPGAQGFTIEPHDIALISHSQASEHPWAWSALAVGGSRHLSLAQRLSTYSTLEKLEISKEVETRKGVIPGRRELHFPEQEDKPILTSPDFPTGVFLELDASTLPPWKDARTTSGDSTDFSAFKSPQLLIKLSYTAKLGRIRAVRIKKHPKYDETICQGAFVTCHDLTADQRNIRAACAAYNSKFAVYFFALTSTSFPLYTCKLTVRDLLKLPLPPEAPDISTLTSFETIDEATRKAFGFTAADWILVEDFLQYTLPDMLRRTPGLARFPTDRKDKDGTKEPELTEYANAFARVVKGTFGKDKAVASTVFTDPDNRKLPVRMLTIHLDAVRGNGVQVEPIEADGLLDKLAEFHGEQLKQKTRDATGSGLGFQRVAYLFHPSSEQGKRVMNLTIVKPDERRYWTRSIAMHDADQLAGAIAKASGSRKSNDEPTNAE
jgi:hypothetical protein